MKHFRAFYENGLVKFFHSFERMMEEYDNDDTIVFCEELS